jgi:hypothetical protein
MPVTAYTSLRRQTRDQWRRWEKVGMAPSLDLDQLVLDWTDDRISDLDAYGALVSLQMERTIEGASTVTMALRDPDGKLFSGRRLTNQARGLSAAAARTAAAKHPVEVDQGWNPMLAPGTTGRAMEVSLDGVVFRLVKVGYAHTSQELTLTFEDRLVYWLRRRKGAKRADRAKLTRAEFILSLLRELHSANYRFVCPELHVRQPRERAAAQSASATTSSAAKQTGDVPRVLNRVYPQHRIGAAGAARLSERQVRAAAELAGCSPTDALHAAQIAHGESDFYPGVVQDDPGDGNVGHGLWQMTPHAWGGPSSATYRHMQSLGGLEAMRNPIQAARQMKWMRDQAKGWSPWYGTKHLNLSSKASASVLTDGQASDVSDTPEGGAGSAGKWETKRYQFARNSDEDSWTAIQRLAQEVGWRCFIVGRSVYFMSEQALYGRRVRYEVHPDDPALLDLTYDVDWGRPVSEAALTVALDRWGAPPGSVVELTGWGPPDGRWLVASISRNWFEPSAQVNLVQPGKALLEPANERTQAAAASGGGATSAAGDGSKASQVYEAARKISNQGLPYTWGGGHAHCGTPDNGTGRDPGPGYDCSGSVCAALAAAGLGYRTGGPADVSGTMAANWGQSGEGHQFTVWANSQHVWMQFHGMGSWRFDTSPYGSGPRGPHLRSTPRPTTGFTARHWPGC